MCLEDVGISPQDAVEDTANLPANIGKITAQRIFHISENGKIDLFKPRPSPSFFEKIKGDVVFGITERLLHNYLFPRDCPRVTFYAGPDSLAEDKNKLLPSSADFVVAIENKWLPVIQQTALYCYAFDGDDFIMLDECAGYYISYHPVKPLSVTRIDNPLAELLGRGNIELRVMPSIRKLADIVSKSTLYFSMIRMRNAGVEEDGEKQFSY